jgi:hypothetical protein
VLISKTSAKLFFLPLATFSKDFLKTRTADGASFFGDKGLNQVETVQHLNLSEDFKTNPKII